MKQAICILSVFITAIFTSCGNASSQGPKEVAQKWLDNFYNEKFEEARVLSTQACKKKIDESAGAVKQSAGTVYKVLHPKVVRVQENGDKASVTFSMDEFQGQTVPPLELVKQDGKWLVN